MANVMISESKNGMRFGFAKVAVALSLGFLFGAQDFAQAQTTDTSDIAKERVVTINGKTYDLKSKLKAILIGSYTYGFDHTIGYPNMEATITRIAKGENPPWTVDTIHHPANNAPDPSTNLTTANLSKYQVFFANYISGWGQNGETKMNSSEEAALQSFVEDSGKGLFLMHSSGDSRYNTSNTWPWYFTVYPSQYTGESGAGNGGSVGKVGIWGPGAGGTNNDSVAKANPIMQGIGWGGSNPDSVVINPGMELHTFQYMISLDSAHGGVEPPHWQGLIGLNPATCSTPNTCNNSGATYNYTQKAAPNGWVISWTYPLKKGNIGYFMEGHDQNTMNSFTQKVWDRYFKQFMYYIAGYDTTLIGPISIHNQDLNNMAVNQSGVTFHPNDIGVLISRPGYHTVGLYDVSGHTIKIEQGNNTPIDYDFAADLKTHPQGMYVMRVAANGYQITKSFFSN